jgi:hypothetical protein
MGNWESKPNKKNENNKLLKNNVPKKPKYNFFSKPPNFGTVFDFGLSRNRKTGNTGDKNLMTRYKIFDEDLDKDNLAQVFISKIMTEPNTEEQIKVLYDLGWRLGVIRSHELSKNTQPEIRKAIEIIKDNFIKYDTQINKKIAELKAKKIANSNSTGTTTASANSAANAKAAANANAKAAANANATAIGIENPAANATAIGIANSNATRNATANANATKTVAPKATGTNNISGGSRCKKSRS